MIGLVQEGLPEIGKTGVELSPGNVVLGGEVSKKRTPPHVESGGDLLHGGFLESLRREQVEGDRLDLGVTCHRRAAGHGLLDCAHIRPKVAVISKTIS